jgi:hypothetical protein
VKQISVGENTDFFTKQELVLKISNYIVQGQEIWEYFGDLVNVGSSFLGGDAGAEITAYVESINNSIEPITDINDKIQFFGDIVGLLQESDRTKRYFKFIQLIISKAAAGNPYAKIMAGYLETGSSMISAINRISNGWNDGTISLTIGTQPIKLKIQKERKFWHLTNSYFENAAIIQYVTKAELFAERLSSSVIPLGLRAGTDNTIVELDTQEAFGAFDVGDKLYLKLYLSNGRTVITALRSDFVKYEGNGGPILFVLGTNATQSTQIPKALKIISPNDF